MSAEPSRCTVEDLARDHLDMLYRYAYRLVSSPADAEDVVHETFLVAAEKIDQIRSPEFARAWLIKILRSRIARLRRRRLPQATIDVFEIEAAQPGKVSADEIIDPEHAIEILQAMPDDYREPLLLFFFEEMRYREIAEVLGVPIGTVMSRIARGKAYLRERLVPESSRRPGHPAA